MRYAYFIMFLLLFPAGCTVYHGGVKDVDLHIKDGKADKLVLQKCDLKVYLAFYGLVASQENCRTEDRGVLQVH